MSLTDRTPQRKKRAGGTCSVALLYERLDDADADKLREWMSDPMLSASAIHRELVEGVGYEHGVQTISRHRRTRAEGGCMCEDL